MNPPAPTSLEPAARAAAERRVLATLEAVVHDLHRGRGPRPALDLDSSLDEDAALDSLARVELGARLEAAFDIRLDEQAVYEATTARALLHLVLAARGARPLLTAPAAAVPADGTGERVVHALPTRAGTLLDVLDWHAARHGERPHIEFYDDAGGGDVLRYVDLRDGAERVAAGLQAAGLEPGERVALMLPTSRAYFLTFYGVLLAGGVPVPIYPPQRRQQLEDHLRRQSRILVNCQAALLVTTSDALGLARLLTAQVESLRTVLDANRLEQDDGTWQRVVRSPTDLAFLQYTSGSTGDPKGVMLSHANLLANMRADGAALAVTPADVFVSWLPLYHDMGLIGAWLGSLYHAVRLVVMPPLSFLARPERWLWAIHRHGGTLSAAPNFAFELCVQRIQANAIEGLDLSRWRLVANGAEAISPRTLDAFCERFAPYGFRREAMLPVYGLAESAVGLTFSPLGRGPYIDHIDRERLAHDGRAVPLPPATTGRAALDVVSCGLPLPGHEIRVVDSADRELPERREGRLQFRGPSATSGYFDRPEETARLLRDGWLETGDRAYIAGGELHLTGRIKDVIIRAGRNVYPAELEEAVGQLDGIRRGHVAVFGVADEASGTERVVVLAETRRREPAARERLVQAINSLASDLIAAPPDSVVLAPPNTVLRTSSGKIRRSACRALYLAGRLDTRGDALWLQLLRLGLAGVAPQLRRARRALLAWTWAGWAWATFATMAALAWLTACLPLPRRRAWHGVRALARTALRLTGIPVTVEGLEHLPAADAACVIVANHQSYLDGIVLTAVLPRPVSFLVKADLAGSALLARPLTRLGALFVERFDAAAGIAALDAARTALAAAATVAVFPEGTFKRMPGLLPFHLGAFVLAAECGVPLVPLAIAGTRSVLRADSWFPHRGPLTVRLGPAARTTPGDGWQGAMVLRDHARTQILARIAEPDLAHESNVVER